MTYRKQIFSNNAASTYIKSLSCIIPNLQKYIGEIPDQRNRCIYSMNYLIYSEILMFASGGKSQRFTEIGFKNTKFLENINKIVKCK